MVNDHHKGRIDLFFLMKTIIQVLKGYTFKTRNPAVQGIHILTGSLKVGDVIHNENGRGVGVVRQMQKDGITIPEAKQNFKIACSIDNCEIGRDIFEEKTYYIF